jgi:hypothetical protein
MNHSGCHPLLESRKKRFGYSFWMLKRTSPTVKTVLAFGWDLVRERDLHNAKWGSIPKKHSQSVIKRGPSQVKVMEVQPIVVHHPPKERMS